jgi:hypothetical protein
MTTIPKTNKPTTIPPPPTISDDEEDDAQNDTYLRPSKNHTDYTPSQSNPYDKTTTIPITFSPSNNNQDNTSDDDLKIPTQLSPMTRTATMTSKYPPSPPTILMNSPQSAAKERKTPLPHTKSKWRHLMIWTKTTNQMLQPLRQENPPLLTTTVTADTLSSALSPHPQNLGKYLPISSKTSSSHSKNKLPKNSTSHRETQN